MNEQYQYRSFFCSFLAVNRDLVFWAQLLNFYAFRLLLNRCFELCIITKLSILLAIYRASLYHFTFNLFQVFSKSFLIKFVLFSSFHLCFFFLVFSRKQNFALSSLGCYRFLVYIFSRSLHVSDVQYFVILYILYKFA